MRPRPSCHVRTLSSRALLFDPSGRLHQEGALFALRRFGVAVSVTRDLTALESFDGFPELVLIAGDPTARDQATRRVALVTPTPLIVEVVEQETFGEVEAARARGADDIIAHHQFARLGMLVRRARERGALATSASTADGFLTNVSDLVLGVSSEDRVVYMNHSGPLLDVVAGMGANVVEHFPSAARAVMQQRLAEARANAQVEGFDTWIGSRTLRVRLFGGPGGTVTVVASDQTETSVALARLDETEARASAILDAMPDLVFQLTDEGTFLSIHAPHITPPLVGEHEIVGRRIEDILPPPVAAQLAGAVRRACVQGSLEIETYELESHGTSRSYEARIAAMGPGKVISVVRDVTEQNRQRSRLRLAEKLVSLGRVAAGVAHEVNSPLTFVSLGLEWVNRALRAPATVRAAPSWAHDVVTRVDELRAAVDRIGTLVRDIKSQSRSSPEGNAADVSAVLADALRMANPIVRYRARTTSQCEASLRVQGDADRIGQVVLNLLINAAEAMPERSEQGARSTAMNTIQVRGLATSDGRVAIEVRDNGIGIPRNVLPHLFEPFFTTKHAEQGTGLGLWICHEIVTDLGGTIEVESAPGGGGTTFRVLVKAASPREAREETPTHRARGGVRARRILVIDDEPRISEGLALLLDGHAVDCAISGDVGLRKLAHDQAYDLVLCDINMPGTTGVDVYAAVELRWPSLAGRFAFMTGGNSTAQARAFLESSSLPVLEKPFTSGQVEDLLARAERRAVAHGSDAST